MKYKICSGAVSPRHPRASLSASRVVKCPYALCVSCWERRNELKVHFFGHRKWDFFEHNGSHLREEEGWVQFFGNSYSGDHSREVKRKVRFLFQEGVNSLPISLLQGWLDFRLCPCISLLNAERAPRTINVTYTSTNIAKRFRTCYGRLVIRPQANAWSGTKNGLQSLRKKTTKRTVCIARLITPTCGWARSGGQSSSALSQSKFDWRKILHEAPREKSLFHINPTREF